MQRTPTYRRPTRRPSTVQATRVSSRPMLKGSPEAYSRRSRTSSYASKRSQRVLRKKILVGAGISIAAVLAGALVFLGIWVSGIQDALHRNSEGKLLDLEGINAVTADRVRPSDPFYVLLAGTDDAAESGISRSDTIILARIDPHQKKAVLVSIPRDTRVQIPGYGYQKINAAYAFGAIEEKNGHSGPEFLIDAVSKLTGIKVHDFVQVDFSGFRQVVDALGGVEVDVPVDIVGDRDAGDVDVYAGQQRLDGEHALVFVRSRDFALSDYQRQANQRTFLQATAKQVLSSDPMAVVNSINALSRIIATSFNVDDIVDIANQMRSIQESDIFTYSIPCTSNKIEGSDYEIPDMAGIKDLMSAIDRGETPDPEQLGLTRQGATPDSYRGHAGLAQGSGQSSDSIPATVAGKYLVDVRNGFGIAGSARAVSDMLSIAGYQQGEIGNTSSSVYTETLVIYRGEEDCEAANDIRARLGYGRVIPSQGRYTFAGNVLVVVGGDFRA